MGPSVACCTSGTGEILIVLQAQDPDPFTPLDRVFSKEIVYNPVYSCYPERYTALLGLFVSEEGEAELIWGHNTSHFVVSYQTVSMKNSEFICSKLKHLSLSTDAYAISSTRLH